MAPAKDEAITQLLRPIAPWLERADVTEITINRPGEIWIRSGREWQRHEIPALNESRLRGLAGAIISFNCIDSKSSIVSVVLPGGERGQIVVPPACIDGTVSMSFRKHVVMAKTLDELDEDGIFEKVADVSFRRPSANDALFRMHDTGPGRLDETEYRLLQLKGDHQFADFLRHAVLTKRNIIVAGKTGSGKTTLARSLIKEVPAIERIVTIEDVHELVLETHPNRVHMIFGAGAGRVSAEECLKSAMRQSPDRIFLSEMRGNESWEYLLSLNTGHPGSVSTIHANGAVQAFHRIESLVLQSPVGRTLSAEAIRDMIYRTVDIVLWMEDWKVKEIYYDPIFAKERSV